MQTPDIRIVEEDFNGDGAADIAIVTPTSALACLRRDRDWTIGLYSRKTDRWELAAYSDQDYGAFIVTSFVTQRKGANVENLEKVDDQTLAFSSALFDAEANPWKVTGRITAREWEGVYGFIASLAFEYAGDRDTWILGAESWCTLNTDESPFYMAGSKRCAQGGTSVDLIEWEKSSEKRIYLPLESASYYATVSQPTPLLFFHWKDHAYGVATLPYYEGRATCLAAGLDRQGRWCGGIGYPLIYEPINTRRQAIRTNVMGSNPCLRISPGKKLRFDVIHYLARSEEIHSYGPFYKAWYYANGDRGAYNRWSSPQETLELLGQGFLHHYVGEFRIFQETLNYDGGKSFRERGMTVGWTNGAMAGYHLFRLGCRLNNREMSDKAVRVLDHIATAVSPSGFYYSAFNEITKKWSADLAWWRGTGTPGENGEIPNNKIAGTPVSEAVYFMLRAYEWARGKGIDKPAWLESALGNVNALCRAADHGVFGMFFDPENGRTVTERTSRNRPDYLNMDWVASLSRAYALTDQRKYLDVAERAAAYYYDRIFSRGCPLLDPVDGAHLVGLDETASHSLRGYLELYLQTKKDLWLKRAAQLAHYACTFKFAWNVRTPRGSYFESVNFRSMGFSGHRYGNMNASMLLTLFQLTRDRYFLDRAIDTIRSAPQGLIRRDGEQGGKSGMTCEGLSVFEGDIRETISHIGDISWITHAALVCKEDWGGILIDFDNRLAGCIEDLDLGETVNEENRFQITIANPWKEEVKTTVAVYSRGPVILEKNGREIPARAENDSGVFPVSIPASSRIALTVSRPEPTMGNS